MALPALPNQANAWHTSYKRFYKDPTGVCRDQRNDAELFYQVNTQYSNLYIGYSDPTLSPTPVGTVKVPKNATVGSFCNFLAYYAPVESPGEPNGYILGFADHNEQWLVAVSIVAFSVLAYLYYNSRNQMYSLPLALYVALALVAIYSLLRSLSPSQVGPSWNAVSRYVAPI